MLPALPAAAAPVSAQDAAFLKMSAAADLAEISLGKVALVQGHTAETKRFAAKVIADHTKALKDARTVGKALDITLPTAPLPAMKAVAKAVSAHTGLSFDLAYLKAEKTGHLQNIAAGRQGDRPRQQCPGQGAGCHGRTHAALPPVARRAVPRLGPEGRVGRLSDLLARRHARVMSRCVPRRCASAPTG